MKKPSLTEPEGGLDKAMDVARRVAEAAGAAALKHFRRGVVVEKKVDRSPVTVADREAEAAMIAVIRAAYPDHGVLGEETGAHGQGGSAWRWVLDPVDGTRGFVRGTPYWGPLVALEHRGEVMAAAMALPVLGETYFGARGKGTWSGDGGGGRRMQMSGVSELGEATVCLGWLGDLLSPKYAAATTAVTQGAYSCWAPGDLSAGAYVLSGRADAWIDSGIQIWDIAPFAVLIEEAGGVFSDLAGVHTHESGNLLAGNAALHAQLLAMYRGDGGTAVGSGKGDVK